MDQTKPPRLRGNEMGATGEVVAWNVRRLRKQSGLDLRGLSARLTELGRPISASGLSKIENREKRVEVDDLVALAIALEANPNALLFQPTLVGGHYLDITGESSASAEDVWAWARGLAPLRPRNMPAHLRNAGLGVRQIQDALGAAWELEREKFRARVSPGAPGDAGPRVSHLVDDAQGASGRASSRIEMIEREDEV